jgi:hypothetical protein
MYGDPLNPLPSRSEEKAELIPSARLEEIMEVLFKNITDEADEGSWIESKDYYKVAKAIAMRQQELKKLEGWIVVTPAQMPAECQVVLGYSKEWVDEDFEPNGIRECFYNDGSWVSAKWFNDQDTWFADYDTVPTHWMPRPTPPKL